MELCHECAEWKRRRDSLVSCVERASLAEAPKQEGDAYIVTCSMCRTWIGKPHFQLQVFQGRLAEPLDPESVEMKACLWSNLPQECLEIVLARLPLGSRVRFSIVCKTWQSLLTCLEYKRLCDSVEPPPAPLVCGLTFEPGKLAPCKPRAQGPSEFEVVKVGLSFLPPKFQSFELSEYVVQDGLVCIFKADRRWPGKPEVETQRHQMPVSHSYGSGVGDGDEARDGDGDEDEDEEEESEEEEEEEEGVGDDEEEEEEDDIPFTFSDGSFVGSRKKVVGMSFCVANPIMRTFKELPPAFGKDYDFYDYRASWRVQIEVEGGHFTVIVLCRRKNKPTVTIYRSKDDSWKAKALTQPLWFSTLPYDDESSYWPQYVLCNGELFTAGVGNCMNIHSLESGRAIWNWNRDKESFDEDKDTEPRCICNVFAWRGRVFCLEQDFDHHRVDFGVWELERSPFIWRKVSFLPEHFQEKLLEPVEHRPSRMQRRPMITLEGATLLGDTRYFSIDIANAHNRFCPYLVGYKILDNTWSLIRKRRPFFWNFHYPFRPNNVGV